MTKFSKNGFTRLSMKSKVSKMAEVWGAEAPFVGMPKRISPQAESESPQVRIWPNRIF